MAKLANGTRVHVEFDGTTVDEPWVGLVVKYPPVMDDGSGGGGFVAVCDYAGVVHLLWRTDCGNGPEVFERAEPEFWPPQAGDIWEANGTEYFVRVNRCVRHELVIEAVESTAGLWSFWHYDLDKFRALNPVLIRRR